MAKPTRPYIDQVYVECSYSCVSCKSVIESSSHTEPSTCTSPLHWDFFFHSPPISTYLSIFIVCYVIYYMCLGAITLSAVAVAGSSNFYDPSQYRLALIGVSKGGAPTSFTWRRDGVVLISSNPYTIAAPVLTSSENPCSERFYQSRVTVTGKVTGVFTYTVTNTDTGNDVMGTLDIEGMYYCSALVV